MSRSLRLTTCVSLVLVILAARLLAHPLSTFGVRLNVSGADVTVTINADPGPLNAKLDALSSSHPTGSDELERIRLRSDLIDSLSVLTADGRQVSLSSHNVRANADGQAEIVLTGTLASSVQTLVWQSRLIYGAYPMSVSHGVDAVESVYWLQGSEQSPSVPARAAAKSVATFTGNAGLGFVHILPRGLDHSLFVLGLFLLTPQVRTLLAQVTVFTLAHSISLGLAMFGLVNAPASIVEPLIALSIAYVGVENLVQSTLSRRRLWLIGAFGLLHGLGFAGVLSAISLPPSQWLPALAGFNAGVELGQLAVLVIAAATMLVWRKLVIDADRRVRRPASVAIACMGLFWLVTRL